ncbi:MAG: tripartite tricarboxylate transporter substrate binding protein [Burkholderiaceae bacterium]
MNATTRPLTKLWYAAAMALAVCLGAATSPVLAQDFPTKPVRILVGAAPGGGTDIIARLVGDKLSQMWKQPVVVENRAGASGSIAMDAVAKAAPDGHTLGMLILAHVVFEELSKAPPYVIARDLAPIVSIARQSNILVVNPAMPVKTVTELITYLKANPGKVSYASAGAGSPAHLAAELFKLQAGVDMLHVPYKGAAPAIQDVMAGTVQVMFAAAPSAIPQVAAGKVRALAVTSDTRSAQTPDIPSLSESGIQYDVRDWQGLVGPVAMPAALVARINGDTQKVLEMPDVRARIAGLGGEMAAGNPARFAEQVRSETAKWKRVVRDAKMEIE